MKKLVYIGNNLETKNPTTFLLLSALFVELGFKVSIYSNKENKGLRLIDMCFGVLKHRKYDFLLIDTYSTSNFYYALITAQLARFFNLKYIPILHGGNLPIRLKKNPTLTKLIFKHSFLNVAPSNYLKNEFEQYNFKEICEMVNMKPTAVRVSLSRARKTIREQLTKQHSYGVNQD